MTLRILTLNIASPSVSRAERQLAWLSRRREDVLVLSETSTGAGSRLIIDRLATTGWDVRAGAVEGRERGVAIASRIQADSRASDIVDYLPSRAELLTIERLGVVGVYVPSRDESSEKIERKRRFCAALSRSLAARGGLDTVVIGDLNVVEPVHRPHHREFRAWEYQLYDEFLVRGYVDAYRLRHPTESGHSWFDYENRGYRFDHVFVSERLAGLVRHCDYDHGPRTTELSDHAALVLELDWRYGVEALELAGSLTGEHPSLF